MFKMRVESTLRSSCPHRHRHPIPRPRIGRGFLALSALLVLALAGPVLAGQEKRLRRALEWPTADTSAYQRVFVEDCRITDPKAAERKIQGLVQEAPKRMADYLALGIDQELYPEIERRAPKPGEAGLVVRVELTQYKPGSQAARFFMVGTGAAHLDLKVILLDAASGNELTTFTETRNFAWGGLYGMSRGITLMEERSATEIAAWLSLCKGKTPDDVLAKLRLPDEDDAPPETPHGTIYILRPQGMVGAANRFRIGVDDVALGESKRKTFHIAYVAPGKHRVWFGSDKKKKGPEVEVEAGKSYYFMAMGMKQMPEQKGVKKLEQCRLVRAVDMTKTIGESQ